jgi:hypothetical protein
LIFKLCNEQRQHWWTISNPVVIFHTIFYINNSWAILLELNWNFEQMRDRICNRIKFILMFSWFSLSVGWKFQKPINVKSVRWSIKWSSAHEYNITFTIPFTITGVIDKCYSVLLWMSHYILWEIFKIYKVNLEYRIWLKLHPSFLLCFILTRITNCSNKREGNFLL